MFRHSVKPVITCFWFFHGRCVFSAAVLAHLKHTDQSTFCLKSVFLWFVRVSEALSNRPKTLFAPNSVLRGTITKQRLGWAQER